MTENLQDSPLEFYPADDILFQSRAEKLSSGTNVPWSEIIDKISSNEKRLLGKLYFYRKYWLTWITKFGHNRRLRW